MFDHGQSMVELKKTREKSQIEKKETEMGAFSKLVHYLISSFCFFYTKSSLITYNLNRILFCRNKKCLYV